METVNHFQCFDYILDHVFNALTKDIIKTCHKIIKTIPRIAEKIGLVLAIINYVPIQSEALEAVIVGLQDKGYQIVPISQLIYTGEYTVDQTGRQFKK